MGEHHFGVGRGRVKASSGEKIDKIARKHGASFTSANIPGQGHSYWFSCRNQGFPFDKQTEDAVWADLEAAGLADTKGLRGDVFAS